MVQTKEQAKKKKTKKWKWRKGGLRSEFVIASVAGILRLHSGAPFVRYRFFFFFLDTKQIMSARGLHDLVFYAANIFG